MGGKLNLTDCLFIGTQELRTFQDNSLHWKTILGYLTKHYGFVDLMDAIAKKNTRDNNCWKVTASAGGVFSISTPSYAFAYPYNLITWSNPSRVIKVPDSFLEKNFWVKIKYAEDSFEQGSIQLNSYGDVIGTNTFFTKKLRGEPNFASVIELFAYDENSGTWITSGLYTVESIDTDTSMHISTLSSFPSTSVVYLYKVIGTFPIGTILTSDMKYPFIYDSCEIELVEETTENQAPNEGVMMVDNTSFYIARMNYSEKTGLTVLEDVKNYFENTELFDEAYSKWWSLK